MKFRNFIDGPVTEKREFNGTSFFVTGYSRAWRKKRLEEMVREENDRIKEESFKEIHGKTYKSKDCLPVIGVDHAIKGGEKTITNRRPVKFSITQPDSAILAKQLDPAYLEYLNKDVLSNEEKTITIRRGIKFLNKGTTEPKSDYEITCDRVKYLSTNDNNLAKKMRLKPEYQQYVDDFVKNFANGVESAPLKLTDFGFRTDSCGYPLLDPEGRIIISPRSYDKVP